MKVFCIIWLLIAAVCCQNDADVESIDETIYKPSDIQTQDGENVKDQLFEAADMYKDLPSFVHSKLVFIQPSSIQPQELPTNTKISLLLSLLNDIESPSPIYVERTEATIRYPQDTTFYIQNFSSRNYYEKTNVPYHMLTLKDFLYVGKGERATFDFSFKPSEQLSGRPFTLIVTSVFRDSNLSQYEKAVFNKTLMFTELDTGLDGQTFFLYLLMAGCVVLLTLFLQNFLTSWGKRKLALSTNNSSHSKGHNLKRIELGTQSGLEGVDLDWLPTETLNQLNKQKLNMVSQKVTKKHQASKGNQSGKK